MPARPSEHPDMGAIPHDGGTTFRVWAPHADRVRVAGTFDGWKGQDLAPEGNGNWSAFVGGAAPGHEYRYRIRNGDRDLWRQDPRSRELTGATGNSVIVPRLWTPSGEHFQMAPWNVLVMYELHVGTFNALDGRPGTFRTATERLPHLRDLGVNAVQLLPVSEFPGETSWGYNLVNPFTVSRAYGGAAGFREFVAACHAHGIAVVADVIFNHWGPTDLDLWRFDGWSEGEGGGIYFYNDGRAWTPWGTTRPDYTRGEVRQYIRDSVLIWLEEYGCDGIRVDGVLFVRNIKGHLGDESTVIPEGWTLMQWVNDEVKARFPGALLIAEDLQSEASMTHSTAEGGLGFDTQWDHPFVLTLRDQLITLDDDERSLEDLRTIVAYRENGNAFGRVIYSESHDQVANGRARIPEEIAPGQAGTWYARQRSALGIALALTAPGMPMLFEGQEFLEDRWFHTDDPLDWSRVETFRGLVDEVARLCHLRRNVGGRTRGLAGQGFQLIHADEEGKILAFHRWDEGGPGDDVVVVLHLRDLERRGYVVGLPRAGRWHVRYDGDDQAWGPGHGGPRQLVVDAREGGAQGLPFHAPLDLGPYSVLVLSQDR